MQNSDNSAAMTLEELREHVAGRGLAPMKLLPVGQLRIATIPSQEVIAACRNRPPLTEAQRAEFTAPIHLTVGQQRIAVLPKNPVNGDLNISPEQLAEWGRTRIGHPDGTVTTL